MPIHFTSDIDVRQSGFHWKFLHQPSIEHIQSLFSSFSSSNIPHSYSLTFSKKKKDTKEQWSALCSPTYQIVYLPSSIFYLCYVPLEATRCQINMPSIYMQCADCLSLFFQVLPDTADEHPIYIHLPQELDEIMSQTIWRTLMDRIPYVEEEGWNPNAFWKQIDLHVVHPSFSKKETIQQQLVYGQLATSRKEADYLIRLSSNIKRTTWLSNYYKDHCTDKQSWYFPSYCEKSVPKMKTYGTLECSVMNERELKKEGMNVLLAINQGNKDPAYLVQFTYTPKKKETIKPCLMVGKGVVFDSGGIDLKPASTGLFDFGKMDMTGSAVVYATMKCLPYLSHISYSIVGLCPIVENCIGPQSIHPGDRVISHSGIPVILTDTDAEGRAIMSDALSYGISTYQPSFCMDIATLTGQASKLLNSNASLCIGRNVKNVSSMLDYVKELNEPMIQMPFMDAYISHMRTKDGSAILTRLNDTSDVYQSVGYLAQFIPRTMSWLHMDIGQNTGPSKCIGFLAILECLKKRSSIEHSI